MSSISRQKAIRKKQKEKQKEARKIQRRSLKKRQRFALGKKLSPEQKEKRSQKLKARSMFKERKRQLKESVNENKQIKNIQGVVSSIFNTQTLDHLAKKAGFIKRAGGEITAFAFVYIVSFGFFGNGKIALSYLVAGLSTHFNVFVTSQALSKRINSKNSVGFLKLVYTQLLSTQLMIGLKNEFSNMFSMFNGVFLQDSTQIILNEELAADYAGNGGGGAKSAMKLDLIYDVANFLIHKVKISNSIVNDQNHSKEILKHIKSKSLVIRDLGYFSIDCLRKIAKKGSYYLSRLSSCTNVYLNIDDEEPVDIPNFLEKLLNGEGSLNRKVYIGKIERFETILVAEKVPKLVKEQRINKFKNHRKKNPSPYLEKWSGYSMFVTNIPNTIFSDVFIIKLYKLRWQIELVFKNLKSNVEISYIKGTNKNRVESLIYGRLITITMLFVIQNFASSIAKDREISGDKLTKLLKSDDRLKIAIIRNDVSSLLLVLESDIELVYKQKRTKKTTLESISELYEKERKIKIDFGIFEESDLLNKRLQEVI